MTFAIVTSFEVKVGQKVSSNMVIAHLECDKATFELTNYAHGTIEYLAPINTKLPVGSILAVINTLNTTHQTTDVGSSKLAGQVGEVKLFAGKELPAHWLVCDGKAYLTTEKPELFAIIGYEYGGEGEYFQVPNMESISKVPFLICES